MSHILYPADPRDQAALSADSTTVPTTTPEQARQQRILQDWVNVGLSADIMRPRQNDDGVWSGADVTNPEDWQPRSHCCR